MTASRYAVALTVLSLAGAARAQSFLPANQIDDFGPTAGPATVATQESVPAPGHASPVVANYVDDFGALAPAAAAADDRAPATLRTARASPIPANYVDDFGPAVSEPRSAPEAVASRQ